MNPSSTTKTTKFKFIMRIVVSSLKAVLLCSAGAGVNYSWSCTNSFPRYCWVQIQRALLLHSWYKLCKHAKYALTAYMHYTIILHYIAENFAWKNFAFFAPCSHWWILFFYPANFLSRVKDHTEPVVVIFTAWVKIYSKKYFV